MVFCVWIMCSNNHLQLDFRKVKKHSFGGSYLFYVFLKSLNISRVWITVSKKSLGISLVMNSELAGMW